MKVFIIRDGDGNIIETTRNRSQDYRKVCRYAHHLYMKTGVKHTIGMMEV